MNIKKILAIFLASFFVSYSAFASGECFEKLAGRFLILIWVSIKPY